MKKKRIFILFIFLSLFISGCDMDYTLEMKKNTFEENFSFTGAKEDYEAKGSTKKGKEEMIDFLYQVESATDKIEKKVLYESGNIVYKYKRNFDITEIEFWPTFSNLCYETLEALPSDHGTLIFRSSSENLCYNKYRYLDQITLRFKTDFKVVDTNADEEEEGIYIWNFTRDTKDNQPIYLEVEYDLSDKNNKIEKKEHNISINIGKIIGIIVGILLTLGILFIFIKKIRDNQRCD